jgi:CxxC motif-containing protein
MSDDRHADETVVATYLCIGCPLGCRLEVEEERGEIVEVRGQSCKKGDVFARQEHTDPRRVVTTTVAVKGGLWSRLPVKTQGDVPKAAVVDVCRLLHGITLEAPVTIGQVIAADVLGTGVDVVASRDLPRR